MDESGWARLQETSATATVYPHLGSYDQDDGDWASASAVL